MEWNFKPKTPPATIAPTPKKSHKRQPVPPQEGDADCPFDISSRRRRASLPGRRAKPKLRQVRAGFHCTMSHVRELDARAEVLGVSRDQLLRDITTMWLYLTRESAIGYDPIREPRPGYTERLVPGHGDAGLPVPPKPDVHSVRPDLSSLRRI